jgi:hypothetical protein
MKYYIYDPIDKIQPYRGYNKWVNSTTTLEELIPYESYDQAKNVLFAIEPRDSTWKIVTEEELIALML